MNMESVVSQLPSTFIPILFYFFILYRFLYYPCHIFIVVVAYLFILIQLRYNSITFLILYMVFSIFVLTDFLCMELRLST
jgi:hypothetical protein